MSFRQFLTPTNLILAAGIAAATVAGFVLLPADTIVPVHWGLDGNVDGTLPRDPALLLLPAITVLIWLIFHLVDRFAPAIRAVGGRYALRATLTGITGLFLVIQAGVVAAGTGVDVDMVRLVAGAIGVLIIILGNAMPKSQPNSFAGLRMRSTMSDPANWQATHRLTGWLLMVAGVLLLGAAALIPGGPVLLGCVIVAVLLPMLIGGVYSLNYRKRSSP